MFRNQSTVITGGSSGLGLALAHALAREGARLTLVARDARKLAEAAAAIRAAVPKAQVGVKAVDVADEVRTTQAFARIATGMGGIDMESKQNGGSYGNGVESSF
jgi:short-subunit dehydrogenase